MSTPCRLFVYLARDVPLAVVVRRGPSDWARLSLWNTETDEIEHGQWVKGRIYERRCDFSADGAWFVAFMRKSSGSPEPGRDSWIVLGRPPWFGSPAVWFVGGTYCAGACFPDGRALWLGFDANQPDDGVMPPVPTTNDPLPYIDRTNDWTNRTVWLNRLLRDGWRPAANAERETWRRPQRSGSLDLLISWPVANENRALLDVAVHGETSGVHIPLGAATWADWDQQDRLTLARDGHLWRWDSVAGCREIANFNDQAPDPQPPPNPGAK